VVLVEREVEGFSNQRRVALISFNEEGALVSKREISGNSGDIGDLFAFFKATTPYDRGCFPFDETVLAESLCQGRFNICFVTPGAREDENAYFGGIICPLTGHREILGVLFLFGPFSLVFNPNFGGEGIEDPINVRVST
jgi:hypothetical protein